MSDVNRRIATEIMGWGVFGGEEMGMKEYYHDESDNSPAKFFLLTNKWTPDTDISQAFEVVEKMQELGYEGKIEFDPPQYERTESYYCKFELHKIDEDHVIYGINDPEFEAFADTPAMAICLAALKCVEAIKEGA